MRDQGFIKKKNILLEPYAKTYLNPKYVFFKIPKNARLNVKDNTYVYKNDAIMTTKDNKMIYSSVSGVVLGVKDMLYVSGKHPSLVIENDFKEETRIKKSARKYINSYTKKDFYQALDDLTTNIDLTQFDKYENLIINGIEKEPFFGNAYFYLNTYYSEILETIDLLGELFNYKTLTLAIKNTDNNIIQQLMDEIGTYPNIDLRLMSDIYPSGNDTYLSSLIGYPSALVIDIDTISEIYNVLKKEMPVTEKYITITGDAVKPVAVINVKKGALLSEVFTNNYDFSKKSIDVYLNGRIGGQLVDTIQYIIDDDLKGLYVTEKDDHVEQECINCGLCHKNCPMGLDPKYVKDHNGKVKKEYKEKCLQCGLCDYVCPQNRSLKEYMGGKNEKNN